MDLTLVSLDALRFTIKLARELKQGEMEEAAMRELWKRLTDEDATAKLNQVRSAKLLNPDAPTFDEEKHGCSYTEWEEFEQKMDEDADRNEGALEAEQAYPGCTCGNCYECNYGEPDTGICTADQGSCRKCKKPLEGSPWKEVHEACGEYYYTCQHCKHFGMVEE